ncbi:MAG: DUF2147 domain-containing protein [Gammaproteobacteria bacterium]
MKKIIQSIVFCASFLLLTLAHAADANSPVGYWKTIDDVTGKPKSILQISQTSSQALSGRIMKIFPSPGKDENEVCEACTGARHNQRIVGMVILEGLKQSAANPNEWSGGSILDPKNGKTYRCKVTVMDGGNKLTVRGYIGAPLFGRTQTWLRVSSPR